MVSKCNHVWRPLATTDAMLKMYARTDQGIIFYCEKCLEYAVRPRRDMFMNQTDYDKETGVLKEELKS